MSEQILDSHQRKHYLLSLYLPHLKKPFVGGDIFLPALKERVFNEFYLEIKLPKTLPENKSPRKTGILPNDQMWRIFQDPWVGKGGLITVPDDLKLTRGIEISIREISQEEWEKGPWAFSERFMEAEMSLQKETEKSRRKYRLSPDWRNRVIGAHI